MAKRARILIAALGSHGDVHPFLAIGRELLQRGHDVRMLMPAMYEGLTRSLGLEFVPIGTVEEFEEFSARPELWQPVKGFGVVAEGVGRMLEPYYRAIEANYESGATVLVYSSLALAARVAQETLGAPGVSVHLSPAIIRSYVRPNKTPPLPVSARMPRWWNRVVYLVADRWVVDPAIAGPINEFRALNGLRPMKRLLDAWGHSPDRVIGLFPEWFAPPPADWPRQTVLTGFPLYDEADVIPVDAELGAFLNAGEPPIAFTPGSAMRHGREFFDAAVKACQRLGRRGLLLSRHREQVPAGLPPGVRHFDYAPFSRLLPRCAAIVHHGGIGTSAQAMAAGIPQLVVTMAHDQPDNAARLKRLGVAEVLPARRLSADRAAAALRRVMDDSHRAACARVRGNFVSGNPFLKTVDLILEIGPGRGRT